MTDSEERFNDYYTHINKNWFKSFDLPDNYSRYSSFNIISDKIDTQVSNIIYSFASMDDSYLLPNQILVKDLYNKLSNTYLRTQESNKPLLPIFNKINEIQSWDDLSRMIGLFSILDIPIFLEINTCLDLKKNTNYLLYINEFNLILPSKEYYIGKNYENIHKEYIKYIKSTLDYLELDLIKVPKIKQNLAEKIFNFEKTITSILFDPEQKRNMELIYNPISFDDLDILLGPKINLSSVFYWIQNLKSNISKYYKKIIYYNCDYIKKLGEILESYGLDFIKLYLKYFIFVKSSNILSEEIYNLHFNFFKKHFSGLNQKESSTKRNTQIVSNILGEIIGIEYIKLHYNHKTTDIILDIINKIQKSSCNIINNCTWMHPKTKKKAINKINKMKILIGYSDVIKDYSPMINSNIESLNLYDTIKGYDIFNYKYNLDKLGCKPNDKEFHMNVYETNAYYSLLNNQIVFPAGILEEPFFSSDASFETNLGAIGAIIGHEISHGFDDQGRKFDSEGNLKTWWLESDIDNYTKKIQPIIQQFNKIKLFNINISGKMTLGENIADYTAVTIITNILNDLKASKDQFKTMYKSYANIWKQKIRQNELIKRLHIDYHAPGRFRTNLILSNIPEFRKIYNIGPDHPMYISPENCVQLWN
jgi:predicted metalloendopeptidase